MSNLVRLDLERLSVFSPPLNLCDYVDHLSGNYNEIIINKEIRKRLQELLVRDGGVTASQVEKEISYVLDGLTGGG